MKIVDNDHTGYMDTYREDYDELLTLMQIPDIRKIIFRKLAVLKDEFRDVIECFEFDDPCQPVRQGNIIHLNPGEYYFHAAEQRLKEYIEFLRHNREHRDMVLEEFHVLLKPLYLDEGSG